MLTTLLVLGSCGGGPGASTPAPSTPPPTTTSTAASPSPGPTVSPAGTYTGTSWSSTALSVEERLSERFRYQCPPGGLAGVVWGTDTYTSDSSVCTAAVHFGLIGFGPGGEVTIEVQPGMAAYTGTTRNGVNTIAYPAYDSSFTFVTGSGSSPAASPVATSAPPASPGTGSSAYLELLSHIHPTIAATCRETDPTTAGAIAMATCAPEDSIVDPGVVIGEITYQRFADVVGARVALQDQVEAYGESLGEDCAAGSAQVLNDLSGEAVGRLLCLEDRDRGGTVVGWWTDLRFNLVGSVLLLEGDFNGLLDILRVAQARP
jgi:hypothetical protein